MRFALFYVEAQQIIARPRVSCYTRCVKNQTNLNSLFSSRNAFQNFSFILNDLQIEIGLIFALYKYADDSTIIAPVWERIKILIVQQILNDQ